MDDNRYDEQEYGLTDDDDYGFSLTSDDDTFTSDNFDTYDEKSFVSEWDDEQPLDSEDSFDNFDTRPVNRPASSNRKETINRIASEQKNGLVRTSGLHTVPDPRLAASRLGKLDDRYHRQNARRNKNGQEPIRTSSRHGYGARLNPPVDSPVLETYKKRKNMFAAFYIVLILMGVGVFLTVTIVVAQNFRDNPPENIFGAIPTPPPLASDDNAMIRTDTGTLTGLVTSIDPIGEYRTITIMDTSSRRSDNFIVPDTTRLTTRINMPMTFAELRVGHMIDISFDPRSLEVVTLNESLHSWERRGRTNVEVDIADATIHVGNESFDFNSQTLVLYRGEPFLIGQIRPVDSVTIVGLGNTAWLVQVDSAHGFLQFQNADTIVNGTVMIGTNLFFALDDIEAALTLPEGIHRIVIEGDNIETFIHQTTIEQGETTSINLGEAELRAAMLHISITPNDADVFLNGELHDLSEGPAEVEFGELHIRVERYGFLPQEERIEITNHVNTIAFTLEEIVVDSTLVIFTVPTNAQIFIGNVFTGYSTLTHTLTPGTHRVTARLSGYEETTLDIYVPAGEEVHRHLLLTPSVVTEPTPSPMPTIPPNGQLPDVPPANPFPNDPPVIPMPTSSPLPPTLPPDVVWPPPLEPTPPPTGTDEYSALPNLPDGNPFDTP